MSISLKTHKMLWGKSGNLCSFPDCKKDLVMDEFETDDPSIIGEEAHIVAKKEDGPRGKSLLTPEEIDKYNNLILLCSIHHKIIDDQEKKYSVELLRKYKLDHERWVSENLSIDNRKEREELIYAGYIDKLTELADVNNWKGWTSYIFSAGQPQIFFINHRMLRELIEFTFSRIWFNRYPDLERAFFNFQKVTNDFLTVFDKYKEKRNPDFATLTDEEKDEEIVWTRKFYRIDEYDEEKYHRIFNKYEYHCFLVEDLVLEMTRALNHLFDLVRLNLYPSFRIEEGALLVEIGPFMDLSYSTFRVEYKSEEKNILYPGLKTFMETRINRDYHRGEGFSKDYFTSAFY